MPARQERGDERALQEISAMGPLNYHCAWSVTAPDGTRRAAASRCRANITLIRSCRLTPRNSTQWRTSGQYLRQNRLSAAVWRGYEAILQACRSAWRFLIDDPDRIQSIGTRQWACATS